MIGLGVRKLDAPVLVEVGDVAPHTLPQRLPLLGTDNQRFAALGPVTRHVRDDVVEGDRCHRSMRVGREPQDPLRRRVTFSHRPPPPHDTTVSHAYDIMATVGDRASRCLVPALVLMLLVAVASCSDDSATQTSPEQSVAREGKVVRLPTGIDATVVSVTDGDTIRARFDDSGETERVRLTGIDTPETKDPRSVVECFGAEASAETHKLLPQGTAVRLETDVDFRDRFGRVLAYVWRVDDGLFVNAALVKGGLGRAVSLPAEREVRGPLQSPRRRGAGGATRALGRVR